jgi:F-type H+-transporting ATPase subunit alpha
MADLAVTELSKDLRDAIAKLDSGNKLEFVGIVTRVGDGVAWVHGLSNAGYSEVLEIETDQGIVEAFALNLMEDEIGAVLLGSDQGVAAGDKVKLRGEVLSVPVGEELLGRVVSPLGEPLDGGPAISTKKTPPCRARSDWCDGTQARARTIDDGYHVDRRDVPDRPRAA